MQGTKIQSSFVSGELSPSMFGQVHNPKYETGAATMRNGFVNFQGGYSSRQGSAFVGMCKQNAPNIGGATTNQAPPRDIPFQFSITQAYALEFGDSYLRIKFQGAYVTETPIAITNITAAGLFTTSVNHGYSIGDWVFDSGNPGFNQLTWIVASTPALNKFTVTDLFGNAVTSATTSAGGTVARIYTVPSPYAAPDLPYLKFSQSNNVVYLTCWNQQTLTEYPPYTLTRNAVTNWTFSQSTFASSIAPPTNVQATAQNSTTLDVFYPYVVTAIDSVTGDESVASVVVQVQNNDIAVNAGSNTITWNQVTNASSYNIFAAPPYYSTSATPTPQIGVTFGYIGSAVGNSFVDNNITPDFTTVPPTQTNPFAPGAINFVTPITGGSGLTQSTANFTITTSTGSGFEGIPIISSSGNFVGFYIQNEGQGYEPADTIAIVTGGTEATGSLTGTGSNPTDGQFIVLNGVTWTFKTTPTTSGQTKIQASVTATFKQLSADLSVSGNPLLTAATYATSGTDTLNITFGEIGTIGNAYSLSTGTYGGSVSASTLTGGTNGINSNATAALVIGPQTGTYPGCCAFFQQRLAYAMTQNNPNTYYISQPGNYTNMNVSVISASSDAITGTPWAQQVNGIQFMVPMPGGLVIFTGAGAWQLSGGQTVAITPADQDVQPQSRYGCSATVPPIPINFHLLFVRENNGVVYDLVYNFWANIYIGNDLTIYSSHLFATSGFTITQWAYAEKPYKLIWAVRNDGTMLSLTYSAEQEEQGWARHDTNGLYVGVCTIEEPPVDAVYTIVQRFVNGVWVYYSERLDNRIWSNPENCFCVDAGLTYPMTFPTATLNASSATGDSNITSTVVIQGGSYPNHDAVAVAQDSTGAGSGATFSITYVGNAISVVTPVSMGEDYTPGDTEIVITSPSGGSGALIQPIITNYVTFTASSGVFNTNMIGNIIRTGNGKAQIITVNSSTSVIANLLAPITATVPNDPNNIPVPQAAGTWSLSVPTSIVTGLNHLNGLTVTGLADGGVISPQVVGPVTGGIGITLPQAASAINVGLSFLPQLQSLRLEIPGPGTVQTKRKNIPAVGVRVHESRGFSIGSNQPDASTQPGQVNVPWTNMFPVKDMTQATDLGQPIPLQTRDYYQSGLSNWDTRGQIAVQQTNPLPLNVDAFVYYYDIGDTDG